MKKKCLLVVWLVLLMFASQALAVQEAYDELVAEMEAKEERELSVIEKQELWNLLEEAKEDTLAKLRAAYVPKEKTYYNNTVCSFGPQFREISSNLTRDWYMFTPVDLSKDGTQTFDLIGGSMYVIGKVTVTVKDGTVRVDYTYNSRSIEKGREYFTFFPDYESVTRRDLDRFEKRWLYGKKYSIEEKLGGDTDVLLFVCNTATFTKKTGGIYRYYETNEERVLMREEMLDMIGRTYRKPIQEQK